MTAPADTKDLARQERGDLAALLATLTPQQWDAPSLCTLWRVRVVVLLALAGAVREVNYALNVAASAAGALIAMGLPHPTDVTAEAQRVIFTFIGVAIAIVVLLVAGLLTKRAQAAGQPAPP